MNARIAEAIDRYDGKRTEPLERVISIMPSDNDINELIDILDSNQKFAEAGTWLLKAWAEHGFTYSGEQIQAWFEKTKQLTHWGAILHFCQALETISIDADIEHDVFAWLAANTDHENKLVRAWSYNGLNLLATQNESFKPEAKRLLVKGQDDEAASVRARLRKISLD